MVSIGFGGSGVPTAAQFPLNFSPQRWHTCHRCAFLRNAPLSMWMASHLGHLIDSMRKPLDLAPTHASKAGRHSSQSSSSNASPSGPLMPCVPRGRDFHTLAPISLGAGMSLGQISANSSSRTSLLIYCATLANQSAHVLNSRETCQNSRCGPPALRHSRCHS